MWVTAVYHQVSLFSLKPPHATSTGGKSLLVPTPSSIKMALLDAAIRTTGVQVGARIFPLLRDMAIALSPPPYIIVNNCFVRIQKPRRTDSDSKRRRGKSVAEDEQAPPDEEQVAQESESEDVGSVLSSKEEDENRGDGKYVRSVAFREYVQYSGPLGLAAQIEAREDAIRLAQLLPLVNYLGKRGGFFQLDSPPTVRSQLPPQQRFLHLTEQTEIEQQAETSMGRDESGPRALLQLLDDWSPGMIFDQVNVYAPSLTVGKDRLQRQVQLPYRLLRSSHGFTLYQRTDIE
jgi:hypothetical protein